MKPKGKPSSRAVRIAFIGAGRMAEALIKGLIKSKVSPKDIIASDILSERREYIGQTYKVKVTGDNLTAAKYGEIVVLAVKPQMIKGVCEEIKGKLHRGQTIISIAAGIPLDFLHKYFEDQPLIRAMPNNPALVGEGITPLAAIDAAQKLDRDRARKIFQSVGEVVEVPEDLMDAITGLSGSGPAFVYLFMEALIEAGETLGLSKNLASQLAAQTVRGSAEAIKNTGKSARELREMVTSPGGTTLEGLKVLEEENFKPAVMDAVRAAARRAEELSREWT